MLRKIAVLAASAVMTIGLAACGGDPEKTASNDNPYNLITPGTILAGTQSDQPPHAVVAKGGGKPEGFAIDLVEEAAKRLSLKVEYKITNLNGILAGLTADQYDMGVAGINATEERKKNADFVKPYYWGYIAVLTQTRATQDGLDDFGGKKVGVVEGSVQQTFANTRMPGAAVTSFKDQPSAIAQLLSGQIDAFVVAGSAAEEYISKEKSLKIAVTGDNLQGTSLPIRKGNTAFVQALDSKIDEMIADGTFVRLYQKWFKHPLSPRIVEFRPGLASAVPSASAATR
jgi:polar amino acid transport system substrate-binding protein